MNEQDHTSYQNKQRFLINFCYLVVILGLLMLLGKYAFSVLLPFVFAFLIASLLNKPVLYISEKLLIKRGIVATISVFLFFLIAGIIVSVIGTYLIYGIKEIFHFLPTMFEELVIPLTETVIKEVELFSGSFNFSFIELIEANMPVLMNEMSVFIVSLSNNIVSGITDIVSSVPLLFMKTIITIVASIFIAIDYPTIKRFIVLQIPKNKSYLLAEAKAFTIDTIIKCGFSYLLIFAITFSELYVGFDIINISYAGIIALFIALLDILPVLGTGSILIPWCIISLFLGDYSMALGIALLYIVITIIRNIIEPKLVGKHMELHPVLALASMLTGLHFFGFIGLFGIPLLIAFLKKLNDKEIIHILH
ncbi:TPA: sporulation integral membrane protein YtvI [Clostridioides difficile]|nr:sporulation integral membrane protein YtvI [Clostridioides difficile]HBF6417242.1 sporulation integral membrane protein YtvI [Clostridioides difficile]